MKSTFEIFLNLLEVKHTKSFSNQYFNKHPHKYNLFGLSKMLLDYGIENGGIRIEDKEHDITKIKKPFIAHFSNDFVVVQKVENNSVSFHWRGTKHDLPFAEFIQAWTGIVLLAESSDKSIEPNYKEHRKTERINSLKKIVFLSACGLLSAFVYINQSYYNNIGISILLFINLAGLYVSWLLLLKQMHVQSQYADKICSLFKQKDCNDVLESKAAKLWGVVGWSDIGFGYFLTNVSLLLLFPNLITSIALLNILTLPYTLWSIWYQRVKANQWCVLCLIVQFLLWAIFITDLLFGYIQLHEIESYSLISSFLICACSYCISVMGTNLLVPKFKAQREMEHLYQTINSIKANETVFESLLKKQPYYETNDCDSIIRFGNSESSLRITVFSNPYCNPCSKMHKRIEKLLQQTKNNIGVQYILSSFGEHLHSTNKYLIAACLTETNGSSMQILSDWFEKGIHQKDDYFKDWNLDMENPTIEAEFEKHEAWKQKTQIHATPTVLINGYLLPESYKIEDLCYITNLDL